MTVTQDVPDSVAIILAAGLGTRMKSTRPKVLHPVLGRPMVAHVADAACCAGIEQLVAVIGPEGGAVSDLLGPVPTAIQRDRLGTAHAVLQARSVMSVIGRIPDTVVVLYGDTPLLQADTIRRLVQARRDRNAGVAVLGFQAADPGGYGRLVMGPSGLERIVEAKDADEAQQRLRLCNSGVMAIDGACLWRWLEQVGNANAKGEYYLTDIVALARADGRTCVVVEGPEEEFLGVNSRAELSACEAIAQRRMRQHMMESGVTLIDPDTVTFSWDTRLGQDVVVWPFTIFGPGVSVADNVEIKGFCHLEGCRVAEGAVLGPYARLRPGADIGAEAHVGNFVEIKNAVLADGVKVNHLSYIGDASVGTRSNIGAGTITCNYDGYKKHRTDIGAGVLIGSNTSLVAPVTVGDGAVTGAGSVLTRDVPAGALALERAEQKNVEQWGIHFHKSKKEEATRG
ncbi:MULTISPECIES: bifunctional UDP-N-acetylglucosamine diphosphorylase/glucosamine-1-phosphate N-acetyltransferase GlmU [unclassified Haematospirillum]|uniref:bifunctional UDP-N-acetylglucosamine diphosphorylase/glucosamine-1-phosphate N-acetyltransferase GlmU n=1 Tax=unclassified Haematospirillum TaxID=2622088 RepID=UPI00143B4992|nr:MULTISPECIES: bifunctional UDP-N-acetylglucosamine diphosphorylase/glucosamine-1-phosphate N-acetyltransferase GlmU [unclassified Haematospirillum]NKD54012.1 bifunctional UDP-N-acetylglucosamine diphosphorylase/glucosamine-1-phosphate N-acetyltransferase GlmU [Haematospirillum sp. H4890]NKD74057.1 bifunctional UDP-N-acetylglucosamine diphosphorylase/glucosamine-1-phosphate N-acetyltransferase GlmU [Haematospirillum sp. H4485]